MPNSKTQPPTPARSPWLPLGLAVANHRIEGHRAAGLSYAIDRARFDADGLSIAGWAFHDSAKIVGVALESSDPRGTGRSALAFGGLREDVARRFAQSRAAHSGFHGRGARPSFGGGTPRLVFRFEDGSEVRVGIRPWAIRLQSLATSLRAVSTATSRLDRAARRWWMLALGVPRGRIVADRPDTAAAFRCFLFGTRSDDDGFVIRGWAFHEHQHVVSGALEYRDGQREARVPLTYGHRREDVEASFGFANGLCSGFHARGRVHSGKARGVALSFVLANGEEIRVVPASRRIAAPPRAGLAATARALGNLVVGGRRYVGAAVLRHLWHGRFGVVRAFGAALRAYLPTLGGQGRKPNLASAAALLSRDPGEAPALRQAVDIILPVFNGMDHLPRTLESIFANTEAKHRLIVIDDASPDPQVLPYLRRMLARRANATLLRNETNMGFPATANRGLELARGHAVLLNADVEVPPAWLERLMSPIIADSLVASTTPFSNAATICSFPVVNVDRANFAGHSTDTIDDAFRGLGPNDFDVDLPTGIGFCMGIGALALRHVGLFDTEAFGAGYGEENDWCMRAEELGFRSVLVRNLFVHHAAAGSFGDDRRKSLSTANFRRVVGRHPHYLLLVLRHLNLDPFAPLRAAMALRLATGSAPEGAVLIVDHAMGGGTTDYRQQMLEERLANGRQAVLLLTFCKFEAAMALECRFRTESTTLRVRHPEDLLTLANLVPLKEIFCNSLVSFDRPFEMLQVLAALGARSGARLTVAMHDFYPVCPSYTLIDHAGGYCGVPDRGTCRLCLPSNRFAEATRSHGIDAWRAAWEPFLAGADRVLCYSQSSRSILGRAYPNPASAASVAPHTVTFAPEKQPKICAGSGLVIGVIGAINHQKGRPILVDMVRLVEARGLAVRIVVIGIMIDRPLSPCLTVTGAFRRDNLARLVEEAEINVGFLPSIWPETFSYVTEELVRLGLPIVAFDLGAPAERLRDMPHTHLVQRVDAESALEALQSLFLDSVMRHVAGSADLREEHGTGAAESRDVS